MPTTGGYARNSGGSRETRSTPDGGYAHLVRDQLTYWKRLFDGELITKADYEKKKEEVLAGATALLPARPAASSIGWL